MSVKKELTFFKFLKNLRVDRRVFSCCLPFPKVLTKTIYYCRQKPGETDIAHMVSDYVSRALKSKTLKKVYLILNFQK